MKKTFIIIMAAAVMAFSGCSSQSKTDIKQEDTTEYAFSIGETDVSKEEFNIYLYETQKSFEQLGGTDIWETDFDGRTAESVAIDNTLNSIQLVKFAVEEAEKRDVTLDDSMKNQAEERAEEMYDGLSDDIRSKIGADISLYESVFEENMLYNIMYEEITGDYSVNEKDFEAYYSEHKDEVLSAYKTNVDSTEPVNDDAVKDYGLEYYTDVMKQDYFNSEYNKWLSSNAVDKNDEVWNTIALIK